MKKFISKIMVLAVALTGAAGAMVNTASAQSTCDVTVTTTIQDAVDTASAGQTVCVPAGTYTEGFSIEKSVTLQGAKAGLSYDEATRGTDETIINGWFRLAAADITVDGFTFSNSSGDGYNAANDNAIHIAAAAEQAVVKNNIIELDPSYTGTERAIEFTSDTVDVEIKNNELTGWYNGMYINPTTNGPTVEGNYFHNNLVGIASDGLNNTTIQYNTFEDNGLEGLGSSNIGNNVVVQYNNFLNNPLNGYSGGTIDARYNYWNNVDGPQTGDFDPAHTSVCPFLSEAYTEGVEPVVSANGTLCSGITYENSTAIINGAPITVDYWDNAYEVEYNKYDAPTGFGPDSWKLDHPDATTVKKVTTRIQASELFGGADITVGDLESIEYFTKRPVGANPNYNYYLEIYTEADGVDDDAWYGRRLNGEPLYAIDSNQEFGVWESISTVADGDDQLTFYDANNNGGVYGGYDQPTLSDLASGSIDWSSYAGFSGSTVDYTDEKVSFFTLATGSGWASDFEGSLDGFTVVLKDGRTATVNLEAPEYPSNEITGAYSITGAGADGEHGIVYDNGDGTYDVEYKVTTGISQDYQIIIDLPKDNSIHNLGTLFELAATQDIEVVTAPTMDDLRAGTNTTTLNPTVSVDTDDERIVMFLTATDSVDNDGWVEVRNIEATAPDSTYLAGQYGWHITHRQPIEDTLAEGQTHGLGGLEHETGIALLEHGNTTFIQAIVDEAIILIVKAIYAVLEVNPSSNPIANAITPLEVYSNAYDGFVIKAELEDTAGTPDQLLGKNHGAALTAPADAETGMNYVQWKSDNATGTLGDDGTLSDTNLPFNGENVVYESAGEGESLTQGDTLDVTYEVGVDYTTPADTYEGNVTYTIYPTF